LDFNDLAGIKNGGGHDGFAPIAVDCARYPRFQEADMLTSAFAKSIFSL
jgi:hypothetical protein